MDFVAVAAAEAGDDGGSSADLTEAYREASAFASAAAVPASLRGRGQHSSTGE
jgi:hypothetical protein